MLYIKTNATVVTTASLKLEASGNGYYEDEIKLGMEKNLFRRMVVVAQVS
jgi:hypothetical protein